MESDFDTELRNAIDHLPLSLRTAARMRFLKNNSYAEIAERLSITHETARKRVQLARDFIKKESEAE